MPEAHPAPIGIDGGAVYQQHLGIARADAQAYATFMSTKSVSRHLQVLTNAFSALDGLEELYGAAMSLKNKKSVEDYLDYFGSEPVNKMVEHAKILQSHLLRLHQTLPEIRPVEIPLGALIRCDAAKLIMEEVVDAQREMEAAKANLDVQVSELGELKEKAQANAKIANVNAVNLETLTRELFEIISIATLTTGTAANMLGDAEKLRTLSNEYLGVQEEAGRLLDRLSEDRNTIQGNLNTLKGLRDPRCEPDDELEKLKAEAELAEIEGNQERLKDVGRRMADYMRKEQEKFDRQREDYLRQRDRLIAEARQRAEAEARQHAEDEQNAKIFMDFLGGFLGGVVQGYQAGRQGQSVPQMPELKRRQCPPGGYRYNPSTNRCESGAVTLTPGHW
ncbi:MAG TPA: hypothetical protein VGB25_08260 [Candidatus Binatia bacterium]